MPATRCESAVMVSVGARSSDRRRLKGVLEARDQRQRALTPPPDDAEGVPGEPAADYSPEWFPGMALVDPYVVPALPGAAPTEGWVRSG